MKGVTAICPCCGESFTKKRVHHRFKNSQHRDRWYNGKKSLVLQAVKGLDDDLIEALINHAGTLRLIQEKRDGSSEHEQLIERRAERIERVERS